MLEKIGHYSLTNPASVYDEEALTALELAGRTAAKVNQAVDAFNTLEEETGNHLQAQDKEIADRMEAQDNHITKMNDVTMPEKVDAEVQKHIENGDFDKQINDYIGNLEERVDNLLGSTTEGSTTLDREVIDLRVSEDGKSYEYAGDAVRSQTSNLRSVLDGYLGYAPEIVGWLNHEGVLCEPENTYNYLTTDFILYTDGDIFTRGMTAGNTPPTICFYDSDYHFISGVSIVRPDEDTFPNTTTLESDVPEGTMYIRCTALVEWSKNPMVFVRNQNAVKEVYKSVRDLEKTVESFSSLMVINDKELSFQFSGYVSWNGGILETSNACHTEYEPVAGYTKIHVEAYLTEAGHVIAFYDSDKNFLPDVSVTGSVTGSNYGDYDIPEEAFYVIVSHYDMSVAPKATLLGNNHTEETLPPYKGKKILTIGDSITAIEAGSANYDRSWKKYFSEIFEPSLLVSTAVPGATWCDNADTVYNGTPSNADAVNNTIGNQVQKVVNAVNAGWSEFESFDMIIIAGGINDNDNGTSVTDDVIESNFHSGTTPITNLSTLDRTTWTGAMRYTVDTLRGLYPDAKIFICTPIQATGKRYVEALTKGEAIKKIALRLGATLINSLECGVYDMTCPSKGQEGDFNDGLHLSPQGAKKLGTYNALKMSQYFI